MGGNEKNAGTRRVVAPARAARDGQPNQVGQAGRATPDGLALPVGSAGCSAPGGRGLPVEPAQRPTPEGWSANVSRNAPAGQTLSHKRAKGHAGEVPEEQARRGIEPIDPRPEGHAAWKAFALTEWDVDSPEVAQERARRAKRAAGLVDSEGGEPGAARGSERDRQRQHSTEKQAEEEREAEESSAEEAAALGASNAEPARRIWARKHLIATYKLDSAFIGVTQLALLLGIAPSTIYTHMRAGRFFLPYRLFNATPKVCIDDLIEWYCSGESVVPAYSAKPARFPKPFQEDAGDEHPGEQFKRGLSREEVNAAMNKAADDALRALGIDPFSRRKRGRPRR